MKLYRHLCILTFYYLTVAVSSFFYSSTQVIIASRSLPIQRIKQSVDIHIEEGNETEEYYFATSIPFIDRNETELVNVSKQLKQNTNKTASTRSASQLVSSRVKAPRTQDAVFIEKLVPLNTGASTKKSKAEMVPVLRKVKFPQPQGGFGQVIEKAKDFANQYLSKEEQRELRFAAIRARASGATNAEVRNVVSRYLNAMLTPEEKRDIASRVDELKKNFGDDAFLSS